MLTGVQYRIGVRYWVGAAYHPRQGAMSISHTHAVLLDELHAGRLHRKRGQALCSTRRFWGLNPSGRKELDCPQCIARVAQLGDAITLTETR